MTPTHASKWEATRRKGFSHYVLVWGVLGWSTAAVGGTLIALRILGNATYDHLLENWPVLVLGWFFGGFAWGVAMWSSIESNYQKYLKRK